jgi:acyl-CoA synthetase (AMP-forming)/AMP-acid ligase II
VVAPSRSRALVAEDDHSDAIDARFAAMGLRLTFGDHVDERDDFDSSSVASRVSDLHAAFADPDVAGILTVIGGFNSNQLLPHLDWDLIAANPKIFCGYSDITALQNAILARTGMVTYSGPHWSSFGMRDHFEQTQSWFTQALFAVFALDSHGAAAMSPNLLRRAMDTELLGSIGKPAYGVALRPGAVVTAEELAAHCGQRLATYKVPAEFRFTDALPVNASGKILKRELRSRD